MVDNVDVVKALGPGPHLAKLSKLPTDYEAAVAKFTSLLQYPFLQSIVLSDSPNNADKDLRTIVADGNSRFAQLCSTDITVAQQVISYSKTVPALLKALTVADYATKTGPLITKYVAEATDSASDNQDFFDEFKVYLLLLDNQIGIMADKIDKLTVEIENTSEELANANVGQVIKDLIKTLFKVASGEDGDAQIASLLDVTFKTLQEDFKNLWKDQTRLKALLKGLNELKKNLAAIKELFGVLRKSLTAIIADSQALLSTWSDIETRLEDVSEVKRKVTEAEYNSVTEDWSNAQTAATEYINAVSGSGSNKPIDGKVALDGAMAILPDRVPRIPKTPGEIAMAKLISILQDHPLPPVLSAPNKASFPPGDLEKVEKAAGAPEETQASLDEMILQTTGVMQQFNELLQIPFLNQLECNDPDKPADKINLQTMVTNYQKMYYDLQQETVPLAQDLQTYSKSQIALIPRLVPSNSAQPGEVGVEMYLGANQTLCVDYKTRADVLFTKSLDYKQKWDNAINAVKQAIAECTTNMETWRGTIDDLTEEIKDLTLKAVLMGIGALICFAAAAFLPGGILVSGALAVGGMVLLGMTISAIEQIGKLTETINELEGRIKIADDTQKKLTLLLPFMEKIAKGLTDITGCWKDITQGLNDVEAWMLVINIDGLLDAAKPELVDSWTLIKDATQRYMDIITGEAYP